MVGRGGVATQANVLFAIVLLGAVALCTPAHQTSHHDAGCPLCCLAASGFVAPSPIQPAGLLAELERVTVGDQESLPCLFLRHWAARAPPLP